MDCYVSTLEWWNNGDVVNQDLSANMKVTETQSWKLFTASPAGMNLWRRCMRQPAVPQVSVFFITGLLRCVRRPCRMANSKKVPPPAIQTHKFTTEESAEHTWDRLPVHVCMLNPEGLLTEQAGTWLDHEKLYIISMSIFNPLEEDETCLLWVKRYSSYFTEELHRAGSLYNTDVIKCFI